MGKLLKYLITGVAVTLLLTACGVTKNLAEDEYMLTGSEIKTDKAAPKDERITSRELNRYIRQSPAPKLLGTDLPVWIYNQSDPAKNDAWNRLLRQLGSEPVILDTTLTIMSEKNLKLYMDSRGFRESESDYDIVYRPKRQRAKVTYSVKQGPAYRIGKINYDFQDKFLEQVIRQDSANTLVHSGELFDTNVLNDERTRIATYLRDRGYYNFSTDNIGYTAYMDEGDYEVDLKITFRQHLAGYDSENKPVLENNAVYLIGDIYIYPDYDMAEAANDPSYHEKFDTTSYRGINIVSRGDPVVKPSALRRAVNLYTGDIYSLTDVRRVVENLMGMGYYKSASLLFDEIEPGDGYLTYVGGEGETVEAVHTSERQLDCTIMCTTADKQGYTIDLEGTTTDKYNGIKANFTYQNRNLNRGSELFDLGLTAGYEFYKGEQTTNSFEFGATAGVSVPRFLAPFRIDPANKAIRPTTRVEASVNTQNRPVYKRTITGANLAYSWSDGGKNTYTVRPISINLVKSHPDSTFLANIQNLYLRSSYESQLIASIGASHVYNNKMVNLNGHSLVIRTNIETAGNITNLAANLISGKQDTVKVFKVPVAQYARGDVNAGYTIPFGGNVALASRLFVGIGVPYGNSPSLPIDRMYYVGGANSMRGWQVRTLGPGGVAKPEKTIYPSQVGDIRLEANTELRFPIAGSLRGALFFDVGNVWMIREVTDGKTGEVTNPDAIFRFNRFYRQLGFNTGIGIRLDLGLVVIRLDWGIQLHNPNMPQGERWIHNFKWANTALNFGVGYPF